MTRLALLGLLYRGTPCPDWSAEEAEWVLALDARQDLAAWAGGRNGTR